MVSLADSLVASSSRPLGLHMRADLTARRHKYQGRSYWVVKEPVGLRYFRFQEEEFAVLNMMRGQVSLEDIKKRFEEDFAPHKITYQDLQQFIGTLHRSGLVVSDAPGQGLQLKKRGDERHRKELLGKLSNILAIRFKGIDPDRLLTWMYPYTRWLFSRTMVIIAVLLAVSALLLVAVEFDVFRSRLPGFHSFFGPKNWFYLALVLAITKIIHEFGHGLLCKHFGGECHEMGVMFLVLTPCLYCNVSDSWMLPSKWHRAAIGAGGMYFEIVMASIATFVWWFSEPGALNYVALRVMFICSISTVIFNGNPLLRFDGYYILADLLEIPNLRQKSTKIVQQLAGTYCLGLEMQEDPFLPSSNHAMFALYTIAAVAYRWFVFCSILFFLNKVFEPYGLKVLGQGIALMGVFGLVLQPAWQLGKFMHVPGRMDQVKWHRVGITAAIVGTIILLIVFAPFPRNVKCPVQIEARGSHSVFVQVPGELAQLHVRPGQHVEKDQLIAELKNYDLELEIERLRSEVEQYEEQNRALILRRGLDEEVADDIVQINTLIEAKQETLKTKLRELERLTLKAPVAGVVLSPPLRNPRPNTEESLPEWSGSPFDPDNAGVYLQPRDLLCRIGNPAELEAVLAVDQKDMDFVSENQEAIIVLDALTDLKLTGTIVEIARSEMKATDPSQSKGSGGELATRKDARGIERPASATYQARVPIENDHGNIKLGYRGKAKIRAGRTTLGSILWRYLVTTFRFYI